MSSSTTAIQLNEYLDILGQQPLIRIYTQICSVYDIGDGTSQSDVVNTLTQGLERLSASFPWLAGQVVTDGTREGVSGIARIVALERTPRLIIKDLCEEASAPTLHTLREARFPMHMLDERVFAPVNTLPGSYGEPVSDVHPVLLVQATFITGGLVLCFTAAHCTMDMTGQSQIIDLFDKACRNEEFTNDELKTCRPQHDVIPLLGETYEPGVELDNQILKPKASHTVPAGPEGLPAPPPPPACSWAYFTFSSSSLTELKVLLSQDLPPSTPYISTDDALTALIWASITRARLPRLEPKTEVKLARAVDVRRYLSIPQTYPGLIQNMTYHAFPIEKLSSGSLSDVAADLRTKVDPETSKLAFDTRALATFMDRAADKTVVSFTAALDVSVDIMLSSWARVDCYELDFDLGLGNPIAVRRPHFTPVESLIYLLPKDADGEMAVCLCLRDEDMRRLKAEEEFVKYARFVG